MQAIANEHENVRIGLQRLESHCREQRGKLLRMASRWLPDVAMAEDVLQEASLRACGAIHRGMYDVSRPFAPWFWRIVRRLVFNKLKRQVKPDRERLLSLSQFTSELADICGSLITHDDLDAILTKIDISPEQAALRSTWHCLTEMEQYLLTAAYIEERSFNELAREQNCTPEALRNRLMRARVKARGYMLADMAER